jgi:2',3'-cyclic-nucleotide 2'-phosphodiesterase (5'-nucleotidase family)
MKAVVYDANAQTAVLRGKVIGTQQFDNRTVVETLTGAQLEQAFLNGFSPKCNPAIANRPLPPDLRPEGDDTCNGAAPVVTGMWKAPNGVGGTLTPVGPADTVRFVTNDFMFTGGDGYTVFAQGTNVLQPGHDVLQLAIDSVTVNSPVGRVVDGRISGP